MEDYAGVAHSAYLRNASTALALYEYLRMFPTAVDFYMVQWRRRKITVPLVLFALIRFTSIIIIIIGNVGIFYPHFTAQSCLNFYLVPLVFKPLQISVSQCIMAVRTYNLSQRWKPLGIFLLVVYTITCGIQWIAMLVNNGATLGYFDPPVVNIRESCIPATVKYGIPSWTFYAAAIIYDVIVSVICAHYLLKYKRMVRATFLSNVMNAMIYEGLLYFVGLTAINIVNLVFYQAPSTAVDVTAVGGGFALVWILSQYIVLSQYRVQERHASSGFLTPMLSTYEPAPTSPPATRATYGDNSDTQGERLITDVIELKTLDLMVMEDDHCDCDPCEEVGQSRRAPGRSYRGVP